MQQDDSSRTSVGSRGNARRAQQQHRRANSAFRFDEEISKIRAVLSSCDPSEAGSACSMSVSGSEGVPRLHMPGFLLHRMGERQTEPLMTKQARNLKHTHAPSAHASWWMSPSSQHALVYGAHPVPIAGGACCDMLRFAGAGSMPQCSRPACSVIPVVE